MLSFAVLFIKLNENHRDQKLFNYISLDKMDLFIMMVLLLMLGKKQQPTNKKLLLFKGVQM